MVVQFNDGVSPILSPSVAVFEDTAERRVVADISKFFSKERLQQEARAEERARLARDLHDGVLQALAGIALQLQATANMIETDPECARARLAAIGDLIAAEQAELRTFVHRLTPIEGTALAAKSEFAAVLKKLCERIRWQSAIRIDLSVEGPAGIPRKLGDDVYRIVQEALSNVARHARAQCVRLHIALSATQALIRVTDDGVGFPYRGSFDLRELRARNLGPVSIRERVAALHGEMLLESSLCGAMLEITLPVARGPIPGSPACAGPRRA